MVSNDSLGRTKFPVPNGFTSQEVSQFLKKYDLSTYHIPKLKKLGRKYKKNDLTLSAMDVLAPTPMKNAAKCDTSCELQKPVSHQNFERNLHFLGSMPVGVSVLYPHPSLLIGVCRPLDFNPVERA